MKLLRSLTLVSLSLGAMAGCGSAPKPPESPTTYAAVVPAPAPETEATPASETPADAPEAAPTEPAQLPTECTDKDAKPCLPDADFAKRLCAGVFPEVALTMFGKSQPWTRAYMRGDAEAWNASGGMTTRAHMKFDEEILVMAKREAKGGIIVVGAGATFDALRWDGTCVSLEAGEMTFKRPPQPKSAPIPWRRLAEATRNALLATPKVQASQKLVQKACIEGSTNVVNAKANQKSAPSKCDKADAAFDKAIVDYVRGGGALPVPARRP